ncbi:MAG: hypothetical protein VXX59_00915 [Candidatus Thermoplasmatota archaeon]|nr:hypothetical protein [Candidatus Thermoplasmatota archaeon]
MTSNLARNYLAKATLSWTTRSTMHGYHGFLASQGCLVPNNHGFPDEVIM